MSAVSVSLTSEVTTPPTCEQVETGCPTLYLRGMAFKTSIKLPYSYSSIQQFLWQVYCDGMLLVCVTLVTLVTLVNSLSFG